MVCGDGGVCGDDVRGYWVVVELVVGGGVCLC